jgi:hypothetical protein
MPVPPRSYTNEDKTMTRPAKALTPSSKSFNAYIEEIVRPLLAEHCSPTAASRLIDLLKWLEQQRYEG